MLLWWRCTCRTKRPLMGLLVSKQSPVCACLLTDVLGQSLAYSCSSILSTRSTFKLRRSPASQVALREKSRGSEQLRFLEHVNVERVRRFLLPTITAVIEFYQLPFNGSLCPNSIALHMCTTWNPWHMLKQDIELLVWYNCRTRHYLQLIMHKLL